VDRVYVYLLVGLIAPLFWLVVLTIAKWIVRRFFPRWEKTLWQKIPRD
jgi:hypothetical protein